MCLQVLVLCNVSRHHVITESESTHLTTLNSVFKTCILFLQPDEQLLKKGANNKDTSDNHRVRADFPEGKDHASIDVRVIGASTCTAAYALQAGKVQLLSLTTLPSAENSDKRLGANNKYQLLVVLVRKLDDQPVGYALSNRFQVRSHRVTVWQ